MIRAHTAAMIGLAFSEGQRLRSLMVLIASSAIFTVSLGTTNPDWSIQGVMLLLTAMLLVQWRASLFAPAGTQLELPIPIRRQTSEWVTSVLQAVSVGVVSLLMGIVGIVGLQGPIQAKVSLMDHLLIDVVVGTLLLILTLMLMGRYRWGVGSQREIMIWSSGPVIAVISLLAVVLRVPEPVVYALWLGVLVALIVTAILLIGRLVGKVRSWSASTSSDDMTVFRSGRDAEGRLVSDGRSGILRATGWLVGGDFVGGCLLWVAFSSWMVKDVGLAASQAQNFILPVSMALMLGIRVLALASPMGQVGMVGGFQSWGAQPWSLIPLPRIAIQRALLRHIGIVALVSIGLNIAFLFVWGVITDALVWTPQHSMLRDLIGGMAQSMAILTAIMSMALMMVGTGLRGTIPVACVAAGAILSVLVYVDNVPVPGPLSVYISPAIANAISVAVLMLGVWFIHSHRAGKAAPAG